MKKRHRNRLRKTSLQRLTRIAVRRWGRADSDDAIAELQLRGSPQTLALARSLCTSSNWRRRALGTSIASQMFRHEAGRRVEYATDACHLLLFAGLRDRHPLVIRAAVTGFAHRHHPAALEPLLQLSTHASDPVRWAVALTLSGYTQPESIATLLRLMSDRDDDVRDYATWAIGEMHENDTAEIRAALWRNLHDRGEHVRGEALNGLANRGDRDVVPYLVSRLTPDCRVYELDAAETLADPVLLPALLVLQDCCGEPAGDACSYWRNRLRDAIAACTPGQGEPAAG